MKGRTAVLFSVMSAFLFAGVAQGEPLRKKTISVEDAGKVAAAFKRPTKALEDALNANQPAILSFSNTLPREGGLPLMAGGKVIGAIGASGGKSSEDAQVAKAGADALALK